MCATSPAYLILLDLNTLDSTWHLESWLNRYGFRSVFERFPVRISVGTPTVLTGMFCCSRSFQANAGIIPSSSLHTLINSVLSYSVVK
jgi:hypothetical protein